MIWANGWLSPTSSPWAAHGWRREEPIERRDWAGIAARAKAAVARHGAIRRK